MSSVFLQGNALSVLKGLPADSFHCAVTSPPYFGLRSYLGGSEIWDGGDPSCPHEWVDSSLPKSGGVGNYEIGRVGNAKARSGSHESKKSDTCCLCGAWKGQLGGEPNPSLYIRHLVDICREVRRVLRPDGVFFINVGDSWAGSGGAHKPEHANPGMSKSASRSGVPLSGVIYDGIKPLDMVLIPEQLALALRTDGWYMRSILIWAKGVSLSEEYNGNPMPESVNGWRWERHRVKVGNRGQSSCPVGPNTGSNNREPYQGNNPPLLRLKDDRASSRPLESAIHSYRGDGWEEQAIEGRDKHKAGAWRLETGQQDHDDNGGFQQDAIWQDCPGCPKCSPNGGYALRKGSWRPTDSYEHILMLTKTNSYYCDREAVLENYTYSDSRTEKGLSRLPYNGKGNPDERNFSGGADWLGRGSNGGRNLRSVLDVPTDLNDAVLRIPTSGSKVKHFAVYPSRLIEPLIKASTSEKGCCPECGSPWARVIDKGFTAHDGETATQYEDDSNAKRIALLRQAARKRGGEYGELSYNSKYKDGGVAGLATRGSQRNETIEAERERSRDEAKLLFPDSERKQQDYINHIHDHGGLDKGRTIGWLPTCRCGIQETESCRVLDMFSGAGTTALVAERLGLSSINIDTSAEYIQLAKARLAEDEQKRITEFIKQAKRLARVLAKGRSNGQGELFKEGGDAIAEITK